ncbi:cobalamin biosynthesis protein CobG [Streptomyces sp. SID3212]|uniref:cobalamin biosynthesis protein CobG n=1 Tax=Streptomyces sp. SID3212 TaxID=2690259 RepID=UPI001F36E679|nr:cobalamin biosynthesis protein CobG [Streptomyces sp. SID3212]
MPPTSPTPVNRDEAPVRERGDACPGALRLHAADDGRLARLRLPAGVLTHHQAEVLESVAERLGDGHLDITSRGNIQLRGLGESCGGQLSRVLYDAGLLPSEAHERIRNIVASPLAGLDGQGSAGGQDRGRSSSHSVQLWSKELDELLCASGAATALSGRFLFALDDGRGDVAALGADVTLLAQRYGTATLHIQTNPSGWRVSATDAARAALVAAETFLTVAAAGGSGAWRVRELPAGHGLEAAVTARLAEAGIPAEREPAPDRDPGPAAGPPAPGTVRSPDGTVALSVHAPLGRLSVAQWRMLRTAAAIAAGAAAVAAGGTANAETAATAKAAAGGAGTTPSAPYGTLRVTPWRGVIVPGLAPDTAHDLLDRLRTAGLVTDPGSPWHGVGACTGRPGCAKALSDVRADAARAPRPPGGQLPPPDLPVHWSGCARRCGHPQGTSWVDVVATGEGTYDVSVDGGARTTATGQELADAVAAARTTTPTMTR